MSKVIKGSKKEDLKKEKVEEVPVVETKVPAFAENHFLISY